MLRLRSSRSSLLLFCLATATQAFLLPSPPPSPLRTAVYSGIKGVETFDGAFTLSPESESTLIAFMECEVVSHPPTHPLPSPYRPTHLPTYPTHTRT